MDKKTLNDLIKHIVSVSSEYGMSLTKTPLIKLLYLIDVEYFRATGKKFTGIDWVFYKYGPYAFELEGVLSGVGLSEEVESTAFSTHEREGVSFKSAHSVGFPVEDVIAKGITQDIIHEWMDKDLNELLNYVYFYTEPMKYAKKRGDQLDFSKINREREKTYEIKLNQTKLDELNAKLHALSNAPAIKEKIKAFTNYGIRNTYYWAEDDIDLKGNVFIDPSYGGNDDE